MEERPDSAEVPRGTSYRRFRHRGRFLRNVANLPWYRRRGAGVCRPHRVNPVSMTKRWGPWKFRLRAAAGHEVGTQTSGANCSIAVLQSANSLFEQPIVLQSSHSLLYERWFARIHLEEERPRLRCAQGASLAKAFLDESPRHREGVRCIEDSR